MLAVVIRMTASSGSSTRGSATSSTDSSYGALKTTAFMGASSPRGVACSTSTTRKEPLLTDDRPLARAEGIGPLDCFPSRRPHPGARRRSSSVRAIWNGKVIAESDDTVVVEGNHYFPREAVDDSVLVD